MIIIEIGKSDSGILRDLLLLVFGGVLTLIISILQSFLARKQLWHSICESMLADLDTLEQRIELLAKNPNKQNHISIYYLIEHCVHMLEIKSKNFKSKKAKIELVEKYIRDTCVELLLDSENENIINVIGTESPQYDLFIKKISVSILEASTKLLSN
jgi:hypothetical protein